MKTELSIILEQKRLQNEGMRLERIKKNLYSKLDEQGVPVIDPQDALAIETAMAINRHQLKTVAWVLDEEPIITKL